MKAAEIKQGGVYIAKVNNKLTKVRVEAICRGWDYLRNRRITRYVVTNLATGRRTTFRSAQRFRKEATQWFRKEATQ